MVPGPGEESGPHRVEVGPRGRRPVEQRGHLAGLQQTDVAPCGEDAVEPPSRIRAPRRVMFAGRMPWPRRVTVSVK
ncbi:hypothetical protein GCM10010324_21380 [Streptomyces hiroshimensis]|uniref:Uncharacterized protein n=1 Tax=Streptomyces hiroshimensis TaxID=66424 RepID=A0ABQ2YAX9_9ACTN|nr:hypothetical protein GCM10010324_21380 [Streptomyces hiroshimensis]